jgi:type I restriction enzyme S subunit
MSLQTFFDNFALLADAPNGVAKLRELILQLAVEGKLVSQDSGEEPASKLLQRIKASKESLAKEEKISEQLTAQPVQTEELPFAIPDDWEWVRLSQITNAVHYGYTASANHALTEVRLLRITDIQNGKVDWASVPGCDIDEKKLENVKLANNDILIARTGGTIGKSYIVENLDLVAVFASYLIRAIPNENLFARYLKLFLESELYWSQLLEKSMGTGQPNVNATSLKSLVVPLPPLKEQKRIVAKVNELMRLCAELEARQQARRGSRVRLNNVTLAPLNKAASLAAKHFDRGAASLADNFATLYDSAETIGRLRSTILQLAVQGKLVPQDPNEEPAHKLLLRIRAEKERLVKEKCLKGSAPSLPLSLNETPFDLPSGWTWTRFGDVSFFIEAGWSPQCERRPAEKDEWGVLKVSSVSWDRFDPDENKALPKDVTPRGEFEVCSGDFLISRANTAELVAKSVVVEETRSKLLLSDKVLRIHLAEYVDKWFYNYFNNSQTARDYYARTASGTSSSMKNISQDGISKLPVAVAPLEEQKRIVAKVKQLMALCDELEAKLRQAEADSEKLMNAAVQHVLASVTKSSTEILAGASA